MSSSAVVVPTSSSGAPQPGDAAAVTKMAGGGLVLSPLPLSGGRRTRKTKKVPKKVLKLFKKGSAKTLKRLMKGGEEAEAVVTGDDGAADMDGARRRRGSRKGSRKGKSRRYGFLY
jgi:hypothetical protein